MKYNLVMSVICASVIIYVILYYMGLLVPNLENFSGLYEISSPGIFSKSVDKVILNDYPLIGKNEISNNTYNKIWWHFPIFSLGSYEQITNNLKYYDNPDNGTCMRADFCGALYHNKNIKKSNIINKLPEAEEGSGARVGYFRTNPNELYFSIPTNENILY